MKVKLVEELKKSSKKQDEEFLADNNVKQVYLLQNNHEQEKQRILDHMLPNSAYGQAKKITARQIELEKINNEYSGQVYTRTQIAKLAINYRLRFLHVKHYRGIVDTEIAGKVIEFGNKTNTSLDEHTLSSKFFILAEAEEFNLQNVKVRRKPRPNPDPLLFYKIDENHYRFIHKWGSDFTIFRRLQGIYWKTADTKFAVDAIALTILFVTSLCFIWQTSLHPVPKIVLTISSLVCCLAVLGTVSNKYDYDESPKDTGREQNIKKDRKLFFSVYNWNRAQKAVHSKKEDTDSDIDIDYY